MEALLQAMALLRVVASVQENAVGALRIGRRLGGSEAGARRRRSHVPSYAYGHAYGYASGYAYGYAHGLVLATPTAAPPATLAAAPTAALMATPAATRLRSAGRGTIPRSGLPKPSKEFVQLWRSRSERGGRS